MWLGTTLASLVASLTHARHTGVLRRAKICLVDNQSATSGSDFFGMLETACKELGWIETLVIAGQGNIGYGRANNLAIARCADTDFHLVLNPDVKLAETAVANSLRFLQQNPQCAMVSPVATAPDGGPLYLAKRFPDFLTLALRGFAPPSLKQHFRKRLGAYERRETAYDAPLDDIQIASGCYMLIRRTALAQTAGFDPAFFLYFEDFDLSYRISTFARVARVADVRIVHAGGSAAAKSVRHVWLFVLSAIRFKWKHR
jgi:GT2 family glycosyltransferase